jgi:hypothetical protein
VGTTSVTAQLALGSHAPIDTQLRTSDKGTVSRSKKQGSRCHFLRQAHAVHRSLVGQRAPHFIAHIVEHRCIDGTGTDCVDPYSAPCQLLASDTALALVGDQVKGLIR